MKKKWGDLNFWGDLDNSTQFWGDLSKIKDETRAVLGHFKASNLKIFFNHGEILIENIIHVLVKYIIKMISHLDQ